MSDKTSAVLGFLKDTVSEAFYNNIENEVAERVKEDIGFAVIMEHTNCAYLAAQAMHAGGIRDDKLFPLLQKFFDLDDDELYDMQQSILTVDRPLEVLKQYMCDNGKSARGSEAYIKENHLRSALRNEPQLAELKPELLIAEIDRRAAEKRK